MTDKEDRRAWPDERLDDLAQRMDAGFHRLDADMRAMSQCIDANNESIRAMNLPTG